MTTSNFKIDDKVQSWFPTNQNGAFDIAAGVIIEIDDSGNNPYLVRFDNKDGTFVDHWLAYDDLELRDWETREEKLARLHNPKTHVATSIMIFERDEKIVVKTFRVGNEQRFYARNYRTYTETRDVDRLLKIINSDNYSREIKRGSVTNCMFVVCKPN